MAEPGNQPLLPEPVRAEIEDVMLLTDNSLRIWLKFEDSARLCVDLPPDSEALSRVVDVLTEAATERLSTIGLRGLDITGFTDADEEDEEEEDE